LKKAQVDKHVMKCRQCQVLSCIDCGKDFWGDDYKEHNKCISEDQKYGGKGFEAKANKGDVKQQQWLEKINVAMNKPGISPKLKDVLNQLSSYDNIPRKKAKFQNWMQNSLRIHNRALQDQVWEVFAEATSNNGPAKAAEEQQKNGTTTKADQNGAAQTEVEPESAEPAAAPLKEKKNKKNKATKKAEQNGTAHTEPSTEPEAPLKQKKKKKAAKAEQNGTAQPSTEPSAEPEVAEPLKERKKNKRERKEERQQQQQKKKQKKANGHPNGQEEDAEQNTEPQQTEEISKKQKKKKRKIEEVEEDKTTNGEAESKPKKSKKASLDDSQTSELAEDAEGDTEQRSKGKFNWKGTIKAVLRKSPEEGLCMKKLRKKVLAEYYSFSGDRNFRSEEEIFSLFNKKVSGNPKFRVVKYKVKLVK